ncbi:MAG: SRPBCC domain-containing protein [Actinomycetota bacterium]
MSDVEREVLIPAPADEVWSALTDPEQLGEWFGAEVEGDLEPGDVTVFHFPDGTRRRALVEQMEPPRRLGFRWLPYETGTDGVVREREGSRVEIDCDEIGDATIVRVVERRVEAAVDPFPTIGFRSLARV